MNNVKTKVAMGSYTISLSEDILQRFEQLKDSTYMIEDLNRIIDRIVELYQGDYDFGDIIPAEDCMRMINTLHEAKKDYTVLTALNVEKTSSEEQ